LSKTIVVTPKDEVDKYANITVSLEGGGTYAVSVTEYRCGNVAFGPDPQHHGIQDALKYKDKVLGASGGGIVKTLGASRFVGVFSGKGSRADIATVLKEADRLKLIGDKPSKDKAIQQIADDYIGLDCNGYAINWLIDNGISIAMDTVPASIGPLLEGPQRKTLEDLDAYDVITWSNHVAVIESIGPVEGGKNPFRTAKVCEAFGAIMCNDRRIQLVSKPTFHFSVGAHAGSGTVWGSGLVSPLAQTKWKGDIEVTSWSFGVTHQQTIGS
jgi:hypothetical protein